jgi:hypothetical protein
MVDRKLSEEALHKVEQLIEQSKQFSDTEVEALKVWVKAYHGFQSMGLVFKWLLVVAGVVSAISTAISNVRKILQG